MRLTLASGSPRRRELVAKLGIPFEVIPSSFEEVFNEHDNPIETARALSLGKARDVARKVNEGIVIGADTLVVIEGVILGKPKSEENAKEMLRKLSGKEHEVVTGVTLIDVVSKKESTFVETTEVFFRAVTEEEIEAYCKTGEPMDKAGSYAIQGGAALFVESIKGDFDTVVGLPVARIGQVLKEEFMVGE